MDGPLQDLTRVKRYTYNEGIASMTMARGKEMA